MTGWRMTTPVTFIIFNRPDTTARVFGEIRRARPRQLLVIADGPRPERQGEAEQCAAARQVIEGVDWPCEVLKNYSATNLGCKGRLASGLDWVFATVEESIILEDDCLPHQNFFPYCEKLLDMYRDDTRVMMIAGTNFLLDSPGLDESYFFSRFFHIWGWATWRRAWHKYDLTMEQWPHFRKERQLNAFYSQRFVRRRLTFLFDLAHQCRINTWDIQWVYSCLFNNGLCAVPRVNLISNIGLTGTHTSGDASYNMLPVAPLDTEALRHPTMAYPNYRLDDVMFRKMMKPTVAGLVRMIYLALRRRLRKTLGERVS